MTEYTCHFCQTRHANLHDYASCVATCNQELTRKDAEAKRIVQEKLAAESRKQREAKKQELLCEVKKARRILDETTARLYCEYPEAVGEDVFDITGFIDDFFALKSRRDLR